MTAERVTVTVDEDHLDVVQQVAEELRRRGMRVESVLEVLGMVTGETDDLTALRTVEGVRSVDAQMRHDVGPPGSHLQSVRADDEDASDGRGSSDEGAQPG